MYENMCKKYGKKKLKTRRQKQWVAVLLNSTNKILTKTTDTSNAPSIKYIINTKIKTLCKENYVNILIEEKSRLSGADCA